MLYNHRVLPILSVIWLSLIAIYPSIVYPKVIDEASLLSDSTRKQIDSLIQDIFRDSGRALTIETTKDINSISKPGIRSAEGIHVTLWISPLRKKNEARRTFVRVDAHEDIDRIDVDQIKSLFESALLNSSETSMLKATREVAQILRRYPTGTALDQLRKEILVLDVVADYGTTKIGEKGACATYNERLQRLLVNRIALAKDDSTPGIPVKTGVEAARGIL